METWKDVVGFEAYQVSDRGRVVSVRRPTPKILKASPAKNGYARVTLRKDGKNVYKNVHTLVMEAFVGPRPEGEEVRHLDGTRTNAVLTNLMYGTISENKEDMKEHGTYRWGETAVNAKLNWLTVKEIRKLLTDGLTQTEIAARFGVEQGTISNVNTNKVWSDPDWVPRQPLTVKIDSDRLLALAEEGKTYTEISNTLGVTYSAVRAFFRRRRNSK